MAAKGQKWLYMGCIKTLAKKKLNNNSLAKKFANYLFSIQKFKHNNHHQQQHGNRIGDKFGRG